MEEANNYQNSGLNFRQLKRNVKKSLWIPFILVGVVVLVAIIFSFKNLANTRTTLAGGEIDTTVAPAIAQQSLNKTFNFPLRDGEGEEVSKVKYIIEKAEQVDEIIVKGQRVYAVDGRTFLILNLKITNDYDQGIQINAKDYIRLVVNGAGEKMGADIHNDPVQIQAISTKQTRIGFPIDDNFKTLTLEVGEINGKKETINLNLK